MQEWIGFQQVGGGWGGFLGQGQRQRGRRCLGMENSSK